MPTVAEILKQTGFTDEQIAALDPKAITAFSGVLSTAEQERATAQAAAAAAEAARQAAQKAKEETELLGRSNTEFYETKIIPGLTGWEEEQKRLQSDKANAEALAAFYKAQNDGARAGGFIPADAPTFTPAVVTQPPPVRDGQGRYVSGAPGATPGSPQFLEEIDQRLGNGISNVGWAMQEYQRLTGQFLPDSFDKLAAEATQNKLPFRDYVARKYDFQGKQQAIQQKLAKEHDDQVAAAAVSEKEKVWAEERKKILDDAAAEKRKLAEGLGNNPDVRQAPGSSRFTEVRKAVAEGARPDPLKMTDAQRRQSTRQVIHSEIAEHEAQPA